MSLVSTRCLPNPVSSSSPSRDFSEPTCTATKLLWISWRHRLWRKSLMCLQFASQSSTRGENTIMKHFAIKRTCFLLYFIFLQCHVPPHPLMTFVHHCLSPQSSTLLMFLCLHQEMLYNHCWLFFLSEGFYFYIYSCFMMRFVLYVRELLYRSRFHTYSGVAEFWNMILRCLHVLHVMPYWVFNAH